VNGTEKRSVVRGTHATAVACTAVPWVPVIRLFLRLKGLKRLYGLNGLGKTVRQFGRSDVLGTIETPKDLRMILLSCQANR
jgi:hypothetical protein